MASIVEGQGELYSPTWIRTMSTQLTVQVQAVQPFSTWYGLVCPQ